MTRREKAIFAPLVVMTIWMGVYPAPILDRIGPSVEALIEQLRQRRWRAADLGGAAGAVRLARRTLRTTPHDLRLI